jgi:hypothetical protein
LTPVKIVETQSGNFSVTKSEVRQTSCDGIVAPANNSSAIEDGKEAGYLLFRQHPWQRCQAATGGGWHGKEEGFSALAVKPKEAKVAAQG